MEDLVTHHFNPDFLRKPQTAKQINVQLTGSSEDLVSEFDYQRRISELELTIASLKGKIWRLDEKKAELIQTIESLESFAGQQRKEIDIVHDLCDGLEKKLALSEDRVKRLEEAIQLMGEEG